MAEQVQGNPPCRHNCPLHTDVPAFIAHAAGGQFLEAFELIRRGNPFPLACGYVCPHPCEEGCKAGESGDPLSIRALERFVGDYVLAHGFSAVPQKPAPALDKVAIVGSGPAGLSAAFDLARLGHQPTVFEARSLAGGRLALTIPEFRLPRHIVELEIECIKQAGVNVLTNARVGNSLAINDLFAQGFRAVLLAVGARKALQMGLPGEDNPGVIPALTFLEAVRSRKPLSLGDWVAVIGSDDMAVDAARSARRLGAKDVTMILQPGAGIPACSDHLEDAREEGVGIMESVAPIRFIAREGRLVALECQVLEPRDNGGKHRAAPDTVPGSEFVFPVDNAIVAAGEQPDISFLTDVHRAPITGPGPIPADPNTMSLGRPGIFAAGSAVTGHFRVVDSILSGKRAALSIDRFLRGAQERQLEPPLSQATPLQTVERVAGRRRLPVPRVPANKRVSDFRLVELGYDERTAIMEASRCPSCDRQATGNR